MTTRHAAIGAARPGSLRSTASDSLVVMWRNLKRIPRIPPSWRSGGWENGTSTGRES